MSDDLGPLKESLAGLYDPERVLGRGGMATVYLARDLKHDRPVAVKVLRPDLAASLAVNRFLQEIRIAARLNHPHIVPLLDSGNVNGVLHFVMPFVEGRSLRGKLVGSESIDLKMAIGITKDVAGALSYAHRVGIVHRDIKPENILFSEGHAIVTDFGIAKAISTAGGSSLTRTGFPIGTLGYMSPEQAAGRTDIDKTTDIYSLASVFYEMMVGEAPGMWVTDEARRLRRFVDALPAHRERLDQLPGSVEQVLVHAMSMRPDERFQTAGDFAGALEQATDTPQRFDEHQVRDVIRIAAEDQAARPTEEGALSLGSMQQIGAEVGLSPSRIENAANALQQSPSGTVPEPVTSPAVQWGGFLGASPKVEFDATIEAELRQDEFGNVLEEIRTEMGEVGRVNETFGKSLSWNSLSFQNTFEGSGRLVHVMVNPTDRGTRIRVTESAGVHPFVAVATAVIGGGVLGSMATGAILAAGAPDVLALGAFGATWAGSYVVARVGFTKFIKRRVRLLSRLVDRITHHVNRTSPSPRSMTGTRRTPTPVPDNTTS